MLDVGMAQQDIGHEELKFVTMTALSLLIPMKNFINTDLQNISVSPSYFLRELAANKLGKTFYPRDARALWKTLEACATSQRTQQDRSPVEFGCLYRL